MKKEIIFSMKSPYRDDFRIQAFRFGKGIKTLAIVGAMRGDEIQQQYICSQLIRILKDLEEKGKVAADREILVIPSVNPFSMNVGKRFWALDGTDINRMFPGYDQGETTQRIAASLFKAIEGYEYGIQMASYYMPGDFIPHVRMLQTGYEAVEDAKQFGLPYVCIRQPLPFDTTMLNYNWQIWNTKAFSVYGGQTNHVEDKTCKLTIEAILRFMKNNGLITSVNINPGYLSDIMNEEELITVKSDSGGILYRIKSPYDNVVENETIARVIHPYEGSVISEIKSPCNGVIFFAHNKPLALQGDPLFKIINS